MHPRLDWQAKVSVVLAAAAMMTVTACGLFGGGEKPDTNTGGGGTTSSQGDFKPGPYTNPATGRTCNAPGGYCVDDKACHSSADKCKKR
jgi:hypothetical protein